MNLKNKQAGKHVVSTGSKNKMCHRIKNEKKYENITTVNYQNSHINCDNYGNFGRREDQEDEMNNKSVQLYILKTKQNNKTKLKKKKNTVSFQNSTNKWENWIKARVIQMRKGNLT